MGKMIHDARPECSVIGCTNTIRHRSKLCHRHMSINRIYGDPYFPSTESMQVLYRKNPGRGYQGIEECAQRRKEYNQENGIGENICVGRDHDCEYTRDLSLTEAQEFYKYVNFKDDGGWTFVCIACAGRITDIGEEFVHMPDVEQRKRGEEHAALGYPIANKYNNEYVKGYIGTWYRDVMPTLFDEADTLSIQRTLAITGLDRVSDDDHTDAARCANFCNIIRGVSKQRTYGTYR